MQTLLLIISYGLTIVASALAGGYLPQIIRMNHVRMQVVLSFVGGMMLGVAVLHLLPHGYSEIQEWAVAHAPADDPSLDSPADDVGLTASKTDSMRITMQSMLIGLLITFFMMRAFHFHQHGEAADQEHDHGHDHATDHSHDEPKLTKLGWIGVAFGLGLHTFMDGIALGAAVMAGHDHEMSWTPAGFGVYLAILLHKPLDALSISTLMAAQKWPWRTIQAANASFGLMCLIGALCAVYWTPLADSHFWLGCLLSASAGVFLCISLSDLLPEVQFHRHDRLQLSAALMLGIGISFVIEGFHRH